MSTPDCPNPQIRQLWDYLFDLFQILSIGCWYMSSHVWMINFVIERLIWINVFQISVLPLSVFIHRGTLYPGQLVLLPLIDSFTPALNRFFYSRSYPILLLPPLIFDSQESFSQASCRALAQGFLPFSESPDVPSPKVCIPDDQTTPDSIDDHRQVIIK